MTVDDERIKKALRRLGSEHEPDPDWQQRVLARIDRPSWSRRAWRWLARLIGGTR